MSAGVDPLRALAQALGDPEPRKAAARVLAIVAEISAAEAVRLLDAQGREVAAFHAEPPAAPGMPSVNDARRELLPLALAGRSRGVVELLGRDPRCATEPAPESFADSVLALALPALATLLSAIGETDAAATEVPPPRIARMSAVGVISAGVAEELGGAIAEAHQALKEILNALDHHAATARGPVPLSYQDAIHLRARAAEAFLAAGRAFRLGDDLRRLAVPAGPEPVATDVNALVEVALHVVRARLRKDADVFVDLASIPEVRAWPDRLALAIAHVLLNAAEAVSERGSIEVSTDAAGGQVAVAVVDTGVGIPAAVLARIFEPGFTTGTGTGLGLSIVREILAEHGGMVEVESVEGQGTSVRLLLPVAVER